MGHDNKEIVRFDKEHSAIAVEDGCVITSLSDLHIFAAERWRIAGAPHRDHTDYTYTKKQIVTLIKEAIKESDHIVLGGDIIELIYPEKNEDVSNAKNLEDIAEKASEIFDELASYIEEQKSSCTLHYLLGNHDADPYFLDLLEGIQEKHKTKDSFRVHPVELRFNGVLFRHSDRLSNNTHNYRPSQEDISQRAEGDIAMRDRQLHTQPYMTRRLAEKIGGPEWIANAARCANVAVHDTVEKIQDHLIPTKETARMLFNELTRNDGEVNNTIMLEPLELENGTILPKVTDVVTGHTHNPYLNVRVANDDYDLNFHNTGTGYKREKCNPLRIEIGKDDNVSVTQSNITKIFTEPKAEVIENIDATPKNICEDGMYEGLTKSEAAYDIYCN